MKKLEIDMDKSQNILKCKITVTQALTSEFGFQVGNHIVDRSSDHQ